MKRNLINFLLCLFGIFIILALAVFSRLIGIALITIIMILFTAGVFIGTIMLIWHVVSKFFKLGRRKPR